MSPSHRVPLKAADGSYVEALLHERINVGYALQADHDWKLHFRQEEQRALTEGRAMPSIEHDHWVWSEKVEYSQNLLSCPTLAVEFEGRVQGMMLITTDGHFGRLQDEAGKALAYVDYLATAPWNLRALGGSPQFVGVGMVFIAAAIEISLEAGFKGRVGLHSLRQAEAFYERRGFVCLGPDPKKKGLKYYELSPSAASAFLGRSTS